MRPRTPCPSYKSVNFTPSLALRSHAAKEWHGCAGAQAAWAASLFQIPVLSTQAACLSQASAPACKFYANLQLP